jgi:hypothetical protein
MDELATLSAEDQERFRDVFEQMQVLHEEEMRK